MERKIREPGMSKSGDKLLRGNPRALVPPPSQGPDLVIARNLFVEMPAQPFCGRKFPLPSTGERCNVW